MKYIILDLEWDNVYFVPEKRFINQILQIGAVKLDEEFNLIDTFEATIKSSVSNRVSGRFTELTGITKEQMLAGKPLEQAVSEYNEFAKDCDVTMTWSDTDIHTIVDNQNTLLKDKVKFFFKNYLDLQKLVQAEMRKRGFDTKNQIALGSAAGIFGIDTVEYELHTALDDSLLCAKLLKVCYNKEYFELLLRKVDKTFFERINFKAYPITDITDKSIDKKTLVFDCPHCGEKTDRLKKWKYRNRWFTAIFRCSKCGYKFVGRVSFKKTFDSLLVKRRTTDFKVKEKKDDMQSLPEKVQQSADCK